MLPAHNIKGTLPLSIANLTQLEYLHLGANELTGSIPHQLGQLTQLRKLNLSENHWVGTIPDSIGNLASLEQLDLSGLVLSEVVLKFLISVDPAHESFGLSGTLPATLANLEQLKYFSVGFNALTGTPAILGALPNLEYMYIYLNQFSGPMPTEFLALRMLRVFSIGSNFFTGGSSTVFSILNNNVNMTQFILDLNFMNGTIPASVGERTDLVYLDMSFNFFNGTLPNSIQNLTKLQLLNVANNSLTGTIPYYLDSMNNLTWLDMGGNAFHGDLPDCLGQLYGLQFLDVGNNQLTGIIPPELGNLSSIMHFNLGRNRFHGTVPSSLGSLQHAYLFDVSGNRLTGTIPATLGQLRRLQFMNMSANKLEGTIPTSLSQLMNLTTLDLSENGLRGSIPHNIGDLSSLQFLYLQGNRLSGSLPSSVSQLTRLQSLLLHRNALMGPLTDAFDATLQRNLSTIQLSNNQLTGQFPDEIFALPALQTLVAVVNCFHGSLPSRICDAKGLQTLALDGLQSATSCRNKIVPLLSDAYLTRHQLKGGVPSCLYGLPALRALHLSGNGLTGSLADDVALSSSLVSLSLSNNILTGSIPEAFQRKQWYELDLSFNHLDGVLQPDFAATYANTSLSLQTNRLSGGIPDAVRYALDLSVLRGNLFSCDIDKDQLPGHDTDKGHYVCGSDAFNRPYYLWLASVFLGAVIAFVLWSRREYLPGLDIAKTTARLRRYYDFPVTPALHASSDKGFAGERSIGRTESRDVTASVDGHSSFGGLSLEHRLVNCKYICELMVIVCKCTLYCAAACCVLLLYYPIVSSFYATHTSTYAYAASAAYVCGVAPFVMELVLFVALMVFVVVLYRVVLRTYQNEASSRPLYAQDMVTVTSRKILSVNQHRVAIYSAYFAVNFIVVLGVNILFIYISLYGSSRDVIAAQVLLSLFKLLWNNLLTFFASVYFTNRTQGGTESDPQSPSASRVFYMQLFVMLLNNIAIPCLVVAAISPSCFYNVFIPAPAVESQYDVVRCVAVVLETGCNVYATTTETVSYDPPYSYSYQCSSSFVRNYAPAFIYMCFTATFIVPLGQELLARWHRSFPLNSRKSRLLNRLLQYPVLPRCDGPRESTIEQFRWRMYFNANQIVLNQLTFVGILLTFGVVFPPLAVALACTVCFVILYSRIKVGQFLTKCVELNQLAYVDKINSECTRVVSLQMIRNSVWMLVAFACCFYTLFLFDTLGDAVGFGGAYWVLIVMPLLPVFLYGAFSVYDIYVIRQNGNKQTKNFDNNAVLRPSTEGEGIVMSPFSVADAQGSDLEAVELASDA
jgi:Leucine-rich repeat (LRR) protein/membrane protein implicated in regulation of membrane protease activity